ncbi:uroporphyrinogen decarboxylase family protein [Sporomusa sp.]|uniref:uroporphyrinogen decarboxylase family protein n=1 Tax=Sporomusa sp. TaxID=2078658 RepID=UPI002BAB5B82|nr:uroporphyrinogen decarboxylase family protein [Sporomusa sp.]HWR42099.1 uroporphyrinogen decarboxylase family protein [Sporomusa sp.]
MNAETAEKLYEQRINRVKTAISLEQPDCVPIYFMIEPTWAVDYAGYSVKDAMWDINTIGKAFEKIAIDFDLDATDGVYVRSPLFYGSLGAKTWVQSKISGIMQHPEVMGMQDDEYPELVADPFSFIANKALPRLYTELAKPGLGSALALSKASTINGDIYSTAGRWNEKLQKEYGIPIAMGSITEAPIDLLSDFLRTMKGVSLDIRRRPDHVERACEALLPLMVRMAEAGFPGPAAEFPLISIPLHIAPYLKPKDFERLYWPTFKKLVQRLADDGYGMVIFFEGDWMRFYDYLQELPPKKILGMMEHADMKLAKEKLGKTMCLTGGYPLTLLKDGTKEECIKKAQEIIDAAAPGGGYIFGFDKCLMAPGDVKVENLKAVLDFVREYGVYK